MLTEIDKSILKMMVDTNSIEDLWSILSIQNMFFDKKSLEHIFSGYIANEKLQGYHTECIYPNKYNKNENKKNIKINKQKVYRLYLDNYKTSDFVPINMSPIDVIFAIDEAYEDLMNKLKNGEKTNLGHSKTYCLNIRILTNSNKKIYDAFPPLNENNKKGI